MRRTAYDAALALGVFLVCLVIALNGGFGTTQTGTGAPVLTLMGLVGLSALPLVVVSRFPAAVFAVTAAASALMALVAFPIGLALGPAVALYALAADRDVPPRSTLGRSALVFGGFAVYLAACAAYLSAVPSAELLHGSLLWGALWLAGERTRLQREQLADLRRDALRERTLAAAEERAQIAREVHDSVGHAVNVIAVRAGAARLRHPQEPERSLAALTAIEELARETVAEMDEFLGALRSDQESSRTPRSLASIDTLVEMHRESGLAVAVSRSGTPVALAAHVDQAAYRIVQEALTNASRHGDGQAQLGIRFGADRVTISVDNPTELPAQPSVARAGHGLLGATERATLLGGSLSTDCREGRFGLVAELPYAVRSGTPGAGR